MAREQFRWQLADDEHGQGALFDQVFDREPGRGEFRGLEFLHVRARKIINEVPAASRMPFRYTINAYRGCSHACSYCTSPETPVLMADGRHRAIADLDVGDEIYGTTRVGNYRRYVRTHVVAHWSTIKPAYRVTLADGTELIASGDHRFLTERGWKFVTGTEHGAGRRPHLTLNNELLGTGAFAEQPDHCAEYRAGYLTGMSSTSRNLATPVVDLDVLRRTQSFVGAGRVEAGLMVAEAAGGAVEHAIRWPRDATIQWTRGFLAGIFDAEGRYSGGILRICNCDPAIIDAITAGLRRFGFRYAIETRPGTNQPVKVVRLLGGLVEHLRFFHTTDPAITRKRSIEGQAIKNKADLRVVAIEPLGADIPMFDITTGTGDFIANGVVSHNCFARPTHDYLGLDIGRDFETKIVVKVNAVARLRAELDPRRWGGDHIAMGTNTDPYQRCEGKYHLTQGIVEVLSAARNPFSILTKSTLVLRDLDLLAEAATRTDVAVNLSIGTVDDEVWRTTEPGTPHPRRRLEAVAKLNEAGISCGVLVAPIIPGISDSPEQIDAVVAGCIEAGARSITGITLHLRPGVKEHFMGWLGENRPDLAPGFATLYPRSYAPKTEQRRIGGLVQGALRKHGGLRPPPPGPSTGHDQPPVPPATPTSDATQLSLRL